MLAILPQLTEFHCLLLFLDVVVFIYLSSICSRNSIWVFFFFFASVIEVQFTSSKTLTFSV